MSVFKQQDANGPFYPSIPVVACWTTWHRVFATPEDFGATYKDYVVKLTAGPRGAGTGTVTIKLIDNDADRRPLPVARATYNELKAAQGAGYPAPSSVPDQPQEQCRDHRQHPPSDSAGRRCPPVTPQARV